MEYLVITVLKDYEELAKIQVSITNDSDITKLKKENLDYLLNRYLDELTDITIEQKSKGNKPKQNKIIEKEYIKQEKSI